jgi:hypothetical protein
MGGMVLMLGVLLWLASRNPVRNVAVVDALIVELCILAVTPLLSLWMTDIRSMYPAYLLWTIYRAARNSRLAVLAEAAGGAGSPLGVSEGRNLEQGKTWSNMTQLGFGGPKTEETVKTHVPSLPCPRNSSTVPVAGAAQHSIANENAQDENSTVCYVTVSGCG